MTFGIIPAALGATAPSPLNQALMVGRGGASIIAASGAIVLIDPVIASLRGGGSKEVSKLPKNLQITPEGKSVLCMAIAMSLHYLGYSFARPITVALFTSASTGYPGVPGAYPFTMAFVSPLSLLLLMGYGRVLEKNGPRVALKRTTFMCSFAIIMAAGLVEATQRSGLSFWGVPAMKFITGPLYLFRESYVQLITSQYWSFMASVLTPNQSAKWFAPIAGLTSISSAAGGMAVSGLTKKLKLSGTLACTGLALLSSTIATESAYAIAEENGFSPHSNQSKKSTRTKRKKKIEEKTGMVEKATKLFARVPVLRALFVEILSSQGLATLLNVCFVQSLGAAIPDDTKRAGWVGNFYALINIFSMSLQFGVLPLLMQFIEPKDLWRSIPVISLACITFQALQHDPSLYVVSLSLLVMKVLEYSARRMLDEMVYVPLDFESRFVGKEVIGVFGYRFGKSLMSLSLSGLTSAFGNFSLRQLSMLCQLAGLGWAKAAWDLSALVPTQKEAQESYVSSTGKKMKRK
eukprot:scaffold721_cov131-Cylindrotheca_fusiformis.AAC.33